MQAANILVFPSLCEGSSEILHLPQLSPLEIRFSSPFKATFHSQFPYSWQMADSRSAETTHFGGNYRTEKTVCIQIQIKLPSSEKNISRLSKAEPGLACPQGCQECLELFLKAPI